MHTEALKNYRDAIDLLQEIRLNPEMKKADNVLIQLTNANLTLGELALENKNIFLSHFSHPYINIGEQKSFKNTGDEM